MLATRQETLLDSPFSRLTEFFEEGFEQLRDTIDIVINGDVDERRVELTSSLPQAGAGQNTVAAEARVTSLTVEDRRAGAIVVFRDIGDRKETERNIRESERRFRTMFESHSAPMLLIDPDTGGLSRPTPLPSTSMATPFRN
ncbi:hypothetical protein [Halovenus salina]|uniref:PAC domain-containing protein n=1 Tax=Halovenus salina TaxID=1510225 RepID=A0ABD5W5A7_9EURY